MLNATVSSSANTFSQTDKCLRLYVSLPLSSVQSGFLSKPSRVMTPRYQNSGQNRSMKTATKWFESVAKFKNLGKTVAGENFIHDEVTNILN